MIITKLKIGSFGCISEKEIDFKEGLNVILGENEAGKSTLFNAIEKTLFVPSNLKGSKFENTLSRFLPVSGGDTIDATLWFKDDNDKEYSLSRIWGIGKIKKSELTLHNKSKITDENSIKETMNSLLPANEATVKTVLMTSQSGLSETMKSIGQETINDLSKLIRNALMANFSVEEFKSKLKELYNQYYSNWDSTQDAPKNNRGINNPWKQQVGEILRAYYEKEEVKKQYDEAKSYEKELDNLNGELKQCDKVIIETEGYIKNKKQAYEAASKLEKINLEIEKIKLEIERLNQDHKEWIISEKQNEEIKNKIPNLEKELQELKNKQINAKKHEEGKKLKERLDKIDNIRKLLQEQQNKLSSTTKITKEDLKQIQDTLHSLQKLEASTKAGRINIAINAKKDLNLSIKKDLSEKSEIAVKATEPYTTTASGIINLEHTDFTMQVTSGEGNMSQLIEQYKSNDKKYRELLKKYQVNDLKDAEEKNKKYELIANEIERLRKNMQEQLGEDTYELLKEKVSQLPQLEEIMDIVSITKELTQKEIKLKELKEKIEENEKRLLELTQKYENKEKLQIQLAEKENKNNELTKEQSTSKELLKDINDIEGFIKEYEGKKAQLQDHKNKYNQTKFKIANLKKPEQSSEELKTQLKELERQFESVKAKGKAIEKVNNTTNEILEAIDKNPYASLKQKFISYMSELTDNRYKDAEFKECLPEKFKTQDDSSFTYELLSAGTKDTISLALRLAMADYFLTNSKGFLIMDDPLVNLDPKRQTKAVEVIKKFAEQKQIILFTCHQSHAEMLSNKKDIINIVR